ncbi:hypothetical protein ES702_05968 [subsurface metagenome]
MNYLLEYWESWSIQLVGVLLIIDSIWSLRTEQNNHFWYLDLGRWFRLALGIYLIWII